jgi:Ca2+-binding RTX toxin-like protein
VIAGAGTDTISAGSGSLLLNAANDSHALTVSLATGATTVLAGSGSATIQGGTGSLSLTGGTGTVALTQGGATTVAAGAGTITIAADGASLTVLGADGHEQFVWWGGADTLTVSTANGVTTVGDQSGMLATLGGGTITNYINAPNGGAITDHPGNNVISLGAAAATVTAGAGADTILPGTGSLSVVRAFPQARARSRLTPTRRHSPSLAPMGASSSRGGAGRTRSRSAPKGASPPSPMAQGFSRPWPAGLSALMVRGAARS